MKLILYLGLSLILVGCSPWRTPEPEVEPEPTPVPTPAANPEQLSAVEQIGAEMADLDFLTAGQLQIDLLGQTETLMYGTADHTYPETVPTLSWWGRVVEAESNTWELILATNSATVANCQTLTENQVPSAWQPEMCQN